MKDWRSRSAKKPSCHLSPQIPKTSQTRDFGIPTFAISNLKRRVCIPYAGIRLLLVNWGGPPPSHSQKVDGESFCDFYFCNIKFKKEGLHPIYGL